MAYYPDAKKITLDDLKKRIEETDLIPSRISLVEQIDEKFGKLKKHGCTTFADLREEIKSVKSLTATAKKTGIDPQYLTLLRREIEGYFPKTFSTSMLDCLPQKVITKLESRGFNNSILLYDALDSAHKRDEIGTALEIESQLINFIYSLLDLTRIQWVSILTARMLIDAGYENAQKVSKADPDELCEALERVNKAKKYFKGNIGLRDIKRLVKAAGYVS